MQIVAPATLVQKIKSSQALFNHHTQSRSPFFSLAWLKISSILISIKQAETSQVCTRLSYGTD